MTMLWTPPAPEASYRAARPALWSMRRTAVAIIVAVAAGALTAVGVSYADTGSSATPSIGRRGGFPGSGGLPGGGFRRGGFPSGFPGAGLGSGSGSGLGSRAGLGSSGGQLGGQSQPDPTISN
jgi:hypothetical protein